MRQTVLKVASNRISQNQNTDEQLVTSTTENRWPIDGHDHHFIERSNIYENAKIRAFLDGTNITLLIASKGMGKTLLMRVKKKLMMDSKSGALLIPATDAEFDEPKLHGSYPATGYSDLLLWKDLWTFSIVVSILTHTALLAEDPERTKQRLRKDLSVLHIDARLRNEILDDIASCARLLPSHYLAHLIEHYTETELQHLRKTMHAIDDIADKQIVSGVALFIDAFDQSLQETFPGNLEAWRAGQLGLIKAAHTLFTKNHHIKVFASIRQEAWAGFIDQDRQVIKGKSLILEPSDSDLKKLFLNAVRRFTGKTTVEQFLGAEKIFNVYCQEHEDVFRYILRHSSASPRSLMQFGKALDETELSYFEPDERMRRIRDVIDNTSAENMFEDYLESQKQMFMRTLNTETRLKELLKLIPSNVLTSSSLVSINRRFVQATGIEHSDSHPFCELFNSGLIGHVRFDPATGEQFQYFRKSHEFDWNQEEILKADSIYVLHPGLVSHLAKTSPLHLNKFIVVEPDRPWIASRGHTGLPTVFVSHSTTDKPLLEPFLDLLQDELNLILPSNLWIDKRKIVPGDNIHNEVERGVSGSDIVVLFASSASLSSGWVEQEWRTLHEKEITEHRTRVIVAIVDDTKPGDLPPFLKAKLAAICPLGGPSPSGAKALADAIATQSKRLLNSVFAEKAA